MNVIFVTQGKFAEFYLDLLPLIVQKLDLGKIGFYLSSRSTYPSFLKKTKNLGLDIKLLKGWEINPLVASGLKEKLDYDFLKTMEDKYGEPFLWNALVMDRRIYNGRLTKYKQDYKPSFSHEEMLSMLSRSLRLISEFIDEIRPNVIIGGFTPVTLHEYLFYLCAKSKGIRYLNMNPTKIGNYVTFSQEIYREFPHIKDDYKRYLDKNEIDENLLKAREYLISEDKRYEGIVLPSFKISCLKWLMNLIKWPFVLGRYYVTKQYLDIEMRGSHIGYFYKNLYNPLKDIFLCKFFPYYPAERLEKIEFAYYPLHVEPEIVLSLFGREYLNQIELIRNIARSIPVNWKLAVKDHPAGAGRKSVGYYKKLLDIPNVILINHHIDSGLIVKNAKLVFTVSGFSGFEAALTKRPVITFGKTFYDVLPKNMVRKVSCMEDLSSVVKELVGGYRYSDKDINALVGAVINNSVSLNLYKEVLKKIDRVSINNMSLSEQKDKFVEYLLKWTIKT